MPAKIRVAILDDHQGIIDGYLFRLRDAEDIVVVATMSYGEEIEPVLARQPVDILLLDVQVPIAQNNSHAFPILHLIPKLLQRYPSLNILVISMHNQRTLIKSVMEGGASGYILKDDQANIQELARVIRDVTSGEILLSEDAYQQLMKKRNNELSKPLSPRELEALSLCAAYPDSSTARLAESMDIAHSTLRNLLSRAYLKLNVRNRSAAVARAHQLDLLTPDTPKLDL